MFVRVSLQGLYGRVSFKGPGLVSRVSFEGLSVFELWPCQFFIGDPFGVDGFSFDSKEVFILLLRHVGRAGAGVNLKATCQKATRQPH